MTNNISTIEFTKRRELLRLREEIDRLRDENQRLAALAYRDALTGVRNRRFYGERLTEELSRLKRNSKVGLSVIVIDLNGFKRLNDTAGHAAGDVALIAVGRLLETLVRAEDVVCRLGGDEFGVLLPDTQRAQAERVAQRIRSQLPSLATVGLGRRGLAIGVASWAEGDDEDALLAKADEEMYADKRAAKDVEGGRSSRPVFSAVS